jgi:hypothetical protein
MLAAIAFALLIALGLGIAAYALTSPEGFAKMAQPKAPMGAASGLPHAEFVLFMIFSFLYLIGATLPLGTGSSSPFDPGRLMIYPVSLRKLFALDFFSELTSLSAVLTIPATLAMAVGAGLSRGKVPLALGMAVPSILFGLALSKWLTNSLGTVIRTKRTRGETLLALVGVLAGLAGALMGQLAPLVMRHAESFRGLRWTPPGAVAFGLTEGLRQDRLAGYCFAVGTLSAYTLALILASYWIARREVLRKGEGQRKKVSAAPKSEQTAYTGWELPLLPADLSGMLEKELHYAMRNAQLRMMALMPLILLAVRFMNSNSVGRDGQMSPNATSFMKGLSGYGEGLMPTGGVLYVFLILTGLACNQFGFEEGGMRTLILAPMARRKILIAKNISVTVVALAFSSPLLLLNQLIFRDLKLNAFLFVVLSFVSFAAMISLIGNWFSIYFPKRMKFGKRLSVSGVAGLLLIPIAITMALLPLLATLAGYLAQSLLVEYVTLAVFAGIVLALYVVMIDVQGRSLERREVEILEAVCEPVDG